MRVEVIRASSFRGTFAAPGDKSVSHRALILAAISRGECRISSLAPGADVRSTAACLAAMGVEVRMDRGKAVVRGAGPGGLRPPAGPLDCGNSGTTMRLLSGIVAGAGLAAVLDGDPSLRRRPMRRLLDPLRAMGARARGERSGTGDDECAPLVFEGGARLVGRRHVLAVASAQVKSALLLAGLWAEGETVVREPGPSRDHTERMLESFGVSVSRGPDGAVGVRGPGPSLGAPGAFTVPGDPSSAAFLVGAALLVEGGQATVTGVCVNDTRTGFLRVLARMGADVRQVDRGFLGGEPMADLVVRGCPGSLRGTRIEPDEVPSLVDEVPLLAVVAAFARGTTSIRGAAELRFKESDRLAQVARGLASMGALVRELPDGLEIRGGAPLRGADVDAASDHRIAMSFAVAGLAAEGTTRIRGAEWADVSFPGFFSLLAAASGGAVRP